MGRDLRNSVPGCWIAWKSTTEGTEHTEPKSTVSSRWTRWSRWLCCPTSCDWATT